MQIHHGGLDVVMPQMVLDVRDGMPHCKAYLLPGCDDYAELRIIVIMPSSGLCRVDDTLPFGTLSSLIDL